MKSKWKNAKGVREGVERTFGLFLVRARMAARDASRCLKLHRSGAGEFYFDQYLANRRDRANWMHAARQLRDFTHADVPAHVVGDRRVHRILEKLQLKAA